MLETPTCVFNLTYPPGRSGTYQLFLSPDAQSLVRRLAHTFELTRLRRFAMARTGHDNFRNPDLNNDKQTN